MIPIDNAPIVREWCEGMAATAFAQYIQPDGKPYLERYYLAGWNPTRRHPGPAVYIARRLGWPQRFIGVSHVTTSC